MIHLIQVSGIDTLESTLNELDANPAVSGVKYQVLRSLPTSLPIFVVEYND